MTLKKTVYIFRPFVIFFFEIILLSGVSLMIRAVTLLSWPGIRELEKKD